MVRDPRVLAPLLALSVTLVACAPPADETDSAPPPPTPDGPTDLNAIGDGRSMVDKVREGTRTQERPEVGHLSVGCTGTLISPDVVITAAHCVGYRSALEAGRYGTFTIEAADGTDKSYTIARYRAFARQLGERDLCLMQLATSVPPDVATPAPLARTAPPDGSPLSVYGYGCTAIGRGGDWQKRKASFVQGDTTAHLCPGDSGGPVFDDTLGAVLRINSGYWQDRMNTDIFALVPSLHDDLRAQALAWTRGGQLPDGAEPDPDVPRDAVAPVIAELTPREGETRAPGARFEIGARVTDDVGLRTVVLKWSYNGTSYGCPYSDENVTCAQDGDRYRWSVLVGPEAPRPFTIAAWDRAGNVAESPVRTLHVRTVGDVAPPTIHVLSPAPEDVWGAGSTVTVKARIRDDGSLRSGALVWDFNGNRYECPHNDRYVTCALQDDVRTWRLRVGTGRRAFHLEATDAAGNSASTPEYVFNLR